MIHKASVRQFKRLTDVPSSYVGQTLKQIRVKSDETGLEFVLLKLSDLEPPITDVDFNSQKITSLANPTDAQDAATKAYADAIASGLSLRSSCRLATTANLAATYAGGVLTATGNGALSVDGVTPDVADRILVKDQTTVQDNGIYTVTAVGDGSNPFVLTRATDMDSSAETVSGLYAFISAGATQAATGFVLTTADPITLDTDPLDFTQFSAAANYIAGDGLTLSGLTFNVGAGTGIIVNSNDIEIDFTAVQAKDATLDALAAYNDNGIMVQTAPDTFIGREIISLIDGGIEIVNGDGVIDNPGIKLDIDSLTLQDPNVQLDEAVYYDVTNGNHKKAVWSKITHVGAWFKQAGVTPNEIWHISALTASNTGTLATTVGAADSTMYAVPFPPNATIGGILDRIGINVNVAAANTVCRLGIYSSAGLNTLYPDALILDAGEVSTATVGTKTLTINQSLQPGTQYWLVMHFDSTVGVAGGPTIRAWGAAAMPNTLGTSSGFTTTAYTYISALAQVYGALPDPFPAGAGLRTGNAPAFIYRYSA